MATILANLGAITLSEQSATINADLVITSGTPQAITITTNPANLFVGYIIAANTYNLAIIENNFSFGPFTVGSFTSKIRIKWRRLLGIDTKEIKLKWQTTETEFTPNINIEWTSPTDTPNVIIKWVSTGTDTPYIDIEWENFYAYS